MRARRLPGRSRISLAFRVIIRRIVDGKGPGDLLEQVLGRYLAGDREIVEGGERGKVVSVLDIRQTLLADPIGTEPRRYGVNDEIGSRRFYVYQFDAVAFGLATMY